MTLEIDPSSERLLRGLLPMPWSSRGHLPARECGGVRVDDGVPVMCSSHSISSSNSDSGANTSVIDVVGSAGNNCFDGPGEIAPQHLLPGLAPIAAPD